MKQKTFTHYGKGSNTYNNKVIENQIMCFLASDSKCHKIRATLPINVFKL